MGSAYKALDTRQFSRRLWAHDALLWKDDAAQVAAIQQRLGWLDSVDTFRSHVETITEFAEEVRQAGIRHVVLLGMGE